MALLQQVKRSIPFLLVVGCLVIPSMQTGPVSGYPGDSGGIISGRCGRDCERLQALEVDAVTCAVTAVWNPEADDSTYASAEALPVFTMSSETTTTIYEYDDYGRLIDAYGYGTIEVSDGLGNTCTGTVTITYAILAGKAKPLEKTITVPYDYGDTSCFAGSLEPVPIMSPVQFITNYEYNTGGALLGGTTSVVLENVGAAGNVTAECKVSVDTCRVIFYMDHGESVKLTAHLSSTALGGYSVKYVYWKYSAAVASDIVEGQVDIERLFVALGITTTSLPEAKIEEYYEATLEATGGETPYGWEASGLPAGLTCSATGVISGTPTVSGDFSVTVTVTDSFTTPNTDQRTLALFVCIVGDANMDGVVDTGDITKVKRIYFGLDPTTPGADVNCDGLIDTGDITKIKRIFFGLDAV